MVLQIHPPRVISVHSYPNLHKSIQVAAANGGIMISTAKLSWNVALELTAKRK